MPDDTTTPLTDSQTAALMGAYDGGRYSGSTDEAALRLQGLIDDDGPTARGAAMAAEIRAQAAREWEAERSEPADPGVAVRKLQRRAAAAIPALLADDLPIAAWHIAGPPTAGYHCYLREDRPLPLLGIAVASLADLRLWALRYGVDRVVWPAEWDGDPHIRIEVPGDPGIRVWCPRALAVAQVGGAA